MKLLIAALALFPVVSESPEHQLRGESNPAAPQQVPKNDPTPPPGKFTPARGIAVLIGDRECRQALELVKKGDVTAYVQLADEKDVLAARRIADAAGLYGTRIYVTRGEPSQIGLAENLADSIATVGEVKASKEEALRVLTPGGKGRLGSEEFTKPFPDGIDDWSHHFHGPDNNPQSKDTVARGPYLTQFIAEPRYGPNPQATVSAGGRMFVAFGHVAWHKREEHVLNTLLAINGFNGALLWKRPLKPGFMVDRSTMIATPSTLYIADDESCKLLDAATGEQKGEIVAPKDLVGGTFWKWMALEGGILYALVGAAEAMDPNAKWGSSNHGWPWNGISKGYNQGEYPWGFAKTLIAIDPATKKVLWHHSEEKLIDSRSICIKAGRLYVGNFGKYFASLDAKTGKEGWRRTAEKDAELFESIGAYRPGHGYIEGWKSTIYLKASEKALYISGPQTNGLSVLSTEDGRLLWRRPVKNIQTLIRDDGVFVIGPERTTGETKRLDPLTGEVLQTYDISRRACTRVTGSIDGIFFRAYDGTTKLDLYSGKPKWISPMRPSCHVGVMVANGHLYWIPWACDCNLQMFGIMGLGPSKGFNFRSEATDKDRLEKFDHVPVHEMLSPADWPTYRANNERTAHSNASIPDSVRLLWQTKPTEESEATAPVAAGGVTFVGGINGVVRAFDTATGAVKWTAYTGGAIRYPPAIADGFAYVGSGDGYAYAFEASTGRLCWRFRVAPAERRISVLGSIISNWAVGCGVIVEEGMVYTAGGMNCMDGTYVYALNVSGKIHWQNNTSGHLDEFGKTGVAVQGDLLLSGFKLYLAGGNAASPGIYNTKDGTCSTPPPVGVQARAPRGRELTLTGDKVSVSGQPLYSHPDFPVYDKSVLWQPMVVTAKNGRLSLVEYKDGDGAGWKLVALPAGEGAALWEQKLPSRPQRWGIALDAQGRILITLTNGQVLCFGK